MAQQMLAYIREESAVWKTILDHRKELAKEFVAQWKDVSFSRFVLVGSGSSNTASQFAKEILERLIGVEVTVTSPTRIGNLLPLLKGQRVVCFVSSQSGKSTNSIHAVEVIHDAGYTVTAVTAHLDSPVAAACDGCVEVLCGEETVGAKTKGMTGTALTLVVLGMELALTKGILTQARYQETIEAFYQAADCARANVEASIQWCAEHRELAAAPHMILIADGTNIPAILEGALKILETLYIPVFAYEFEEYLHGVGNTLNTDSWLVFLTSEQGDRKRFMNLYDFAQEHGSHDYIMATGAPTGHPGELLLRSSGNALTLPFETLIPFQVISAVLSEEKGINCDHPQFTDFAERMNTKAQK